MCPTIRNSRQSCSGLPIALLWRHFSDLVVDAFAPKPSLFRRRASTFCRAPYTGSETRNSQLRLVNAHFIARRVLRPADRSDTLFLRH